MSVVKKALIVSLAISSLAFASGVQANTVVCDFTSWKGMDNEAGAISWVGLGFEVEERRSRLRVRQENGLTPWFPVTARITNRFTTYVHNVQEADIAGQLYDNRYGFRVYQSGRCEALLQAPGYVPIEGQGRVR